MSHPAATAAPLPSSSAPLVPCAGRVAGALAALRAAGCSLPSWPSSITFSVLPLPPLPLQRILILLFFVVLVS